MEGLNRFAQLIYQSLKIIQSVINVLGEVD